ncbi:flagellar basal body-associated protein FliL [Stutzerimonas tarimensis]|uniref:Flagellar protein FliL n=1 Tax=Stutzerimonas tarimensis TaxID=1507735 RepID=A0ABV7T8W1_9GAMM
MAKKPKAAKAPGDGNGGGKLKLIILGVVALLLVAGISVAVTWFLLSKDSDAEPDQAAAPVAQPAIYEALAPAFVINYRHDNRPRYMQVSVALMSRDQKSLDALKTHMPLLRNRLVMLFSSQDFAQLMTPVGKEMLRQQATASVQELAQQETGQLAIEQVLFTNFVLQ